jgi:Sortase domain
VRNDEPRGSRPPYGRRSRGRGDPRRRRGSRWSAVATAVVGGVLVGGSIAAWTRPVPGGIRTDGANEGVRSFPGRDRPIHIEIPSIRVSAAIVSLGLNADRTLEVPSDFHHAGWYVGSSTPGLPGPAVIVGHLDSRRGPAVFYRLRLLSPGSRVTVQLGGGSQRAFVVERVSEYSKARFPTQAVYGATTGPSLRLITCGGPFDASSGHYLENVVVFARAAPSRLEAHRTPNWPSRA